MRPPIDFEKAGAYEERRESFDSEDGDGPHPVDEAHVSLTRDSAPAPAVPYSAFSLRRRRFILAVVTAAGFFGPLCGAIYLPSIQVLQSVYKVSATVMNGTVSIYLLVFAVGPLFGAAASDIGGRKLVYMIGLGSFLVANSLLAVLPAQIGYLYILRIFQAFGSCIVFSVGAGTVADITEPSARASALAWFLMGPQLGPILGPLIGGQFASPTRWRWIFGFLTFTCLPIYICIVFSVPETLRSLVGNGSCVAHQPWFSIPSFRTQPCTDNKIPKAPRPSLKKFIHLLKYPPHLIVSVNGALQFAGLFGMYIAFPPVWRKQYNFKPATVGYIFLVPGVCMFVSSILVGRLSDHMRRKAIANSPDGKVAPERRIAIQIPGFIMAGVGTVLFGWLTEHKAPAVFPMLASGLAATGVAIVFVSSTSFQTECDPAQTATLVALGGLLRNMAAALCAVLIPSMLKGVGLKWTFTILGFCGFICLPGVFLILIRGKKWREDMKRQAELLQKAG